MIDEIMRVSIQAGAWDILVAVGTVGAVIVALGIAVWSILSRRRERRESLAFLRKQILAYLHITKKNFDNFFYKKNTHATNWKNFNRGNLEVLEMLFRSSTPLAEKDLEIFMQFILLYKSDPNLSHTEVRLFEAQLNDVRRIFSSEKNPRRGKRKKR